MWGGGNVLIDCNIQIFGNNNVIEIGENNLLKEVTLWIEDFNGRIHIGNNNKFCGKIHIASVEGQEVIVGDENLFSSHIYITTTDSHSIVDLANGKRINPSLPVNIGDHNWVGTRTVILKGVSIGRNVIVGAGAIVAKSPESNNCVMAGNPAKIIKRGVSWDINRI